MEPDQGTYSQFLQPLVDEPGSTYSLVSESGIIWSELDTIMNKEHLPHQEAYPPGDPRLYEVNKTLLVVANLACHPEKPYKGFSSLTRMVLYQFLSAVKANSLFHRYGMVRMLLWVGDDERTKIIPRSLGSRRKAAVEMEMTCSKVNEIASSTKAAVIPRLHRDPRLDFKALPQIVRRMQEKGFTIPVGRESLLIAEWAEGSSKTISAHRSLPKSIAVLEELGENIQADWGRMSEDEAKQRIRLYMSKRSNIMTHRRKMEALSQLVHINHEIVALEKKIYKNMDSVEVEKLENAIVPLAEKFETIHDAHLNSKDKDELTVLIDNSRTFHDQLLLWDRREFEPLRAQADEFYPTQEIALLDLEPRSWPILREHYPESDEILEFILAHLFLQPVSSLKFGLGSLWPGAYNWLVEHCPSLTDPNKGGWKDLEKVPARRISPEMLQEILEVWFEWPWRPSRFDIMNRLGSVNFDPDAVEPDD
jgi:transcription factor 1